MKISQPYKDIRPFKRSKSPVHNHPKAGKKPIFEKMPKKDPNKPTVKDKQMIDR